MNAEWPQADWIPDEHHGTASNQQPRPLAAKSDTGRAFRRRTAGDARKAAAPAARQHTGSLAESLADLIAADATRLGRFQP